MSRMEDGLRWLDGRLSAIDKKVDKNHEETQATLSVHDLALKEIVPVVKEIKPALEAATAALEILTKILKSRWVKRGGAAVGAAFFGAMGVQIQSLWSIDSNVEQAVDNTTVYDGYGNPIGTAASSAKSAADNSADAARQASATGKKLDTLVQPKAPKRKSAPRKAQPPPPQRGFFEEFMNRLFP